MVGGGRSLAEPVCGVKFPAIREKNREFSENRAFLAKMDAQNAGDFKGLQLKSLRIGTGHLICGARN